MNIVIRQVKNKDLDSCYKVETLCYTTEGASKEKIKKRISVFPKGFLVAEHNGRIIGIINGTLTNRSDINDEELKDMIDFDEHGENVIIFSVAVLPSYQGKGVAKLLLNKFIIKCKKMKTQKILLICKKNLIKMYEKFGFLLIGKSKSRHGGFAWYEMVLNFT
tara:strand:+ start:5541 stop:6029 length:489 start_codon:yes stop_codon:yes gene_type:complete